MNLMIEKLPQIAAGTKDRLSKALSGNKTTQSALLGEYINSKYNDELIEAMRILYQYYLLNKDLSVYISRIINLLPREDIELKRICQVLLCEFACSPMARQTKQGDVLMLAIAPTYKDLVSFNSSTKLCALKALPQLRIPEIISLLMASIKQISTDKNPLIRKVAALTILKLHTLNSEDVAEEDFMESIQFLLRDTPSVRQAALFTLKQINYDSTFKYIHNKYFILIKDLFQLNHLELERALYQLHQYAIMYFENGNKDLNILLDQCELLLKLPYPGVVIAISNIFLDFPVDQKIKRLIKTLIRFLNISSESKFVILQQLKQIAVKYPQFVREYYRSFTIIQIEKLYCKLLKIEILYHLVDEFNFNSILDELLYQARSNNSDLVGLAVSLLSKTTQKYPQFLKRIVRSLMDILKTGRPETKNHVIASFCNIMSTTDNNLSLLAICLQNLDDISEVTYKAQIINLLIQQSDKIPTIACENLRKLSLSFTSQHENVKYQILLLSQKIQNDVLKNYVMTLAQFDQSLLVRDLHRILTIGIQIPELTPVTRKQMDLSKTTLQIGSLSQIIGHPLKGYTKYEYLNINTDELRKVIIEPKPVQVKPITAPVPQTKSQEETQVIIPEVVDKKKLNKQIEEDVKKQYNLEQVLEDFFTTES